MSDYASKWSTQESIMEDLIRGDLTILSGITSKTCSATRSTSSSASASRLPPARRAKTGSVAEMTSNTNWS